jgi:hypothetical protein
MVNVFLKMKYSFISALVFFLVANPEMYSLTQNLFGTWIPILESNGVTPAGVLLHTLLFFLLILSLMVLPSV